jgi:flagellar biosynthesis protein FliQ
MLRLVAAVCNVPAMLTSIVHCHSLKIRPRLSIQLFYVLGMLMMHKKTLLPWNYNTVQSLPKIAKTVHHMFTSAPWHNTQLPDYYVTLLQRFLCISISSYWFWMNYTTWRTSNITKCNTEHSSSSVPHTCEKPVTWENNIK